MRKNNDNSNKVDIKRNIEVSFRTRNIVIRAKAVERSKGGKKYRYDQIINGGWSIIEGYNPY